MQGDGARPNLFEAYLTFPFNVFGGPEAASKLTFTCKASQLPGSTLGTVPQYYFGREIKFPGNRMFQDWMVTIVNDEDFLVRNAFENWMNLINSHVGNVRDPTMLSSLGYSVEAQVLQYGKVGTPISAYNFSGMFPVDISPLDVDWGANDMMQEFQCTLAYQYWTKTLPLGVTT